LERLRRGGRGEIHEQLRDFRGPLDLWAVTTVWENDEPRGRHGVEDELRALDCAELVAAAPDEQRWDTDVRDRERVGLVIGGERAQRGGRVAN
jgi:hypothetical protein